MFTEDYVLRIINQAVAALLKILNFKKAGDYQQAQQTINDALEQLTGLKADIVKLLDDEGLFNTLTRRGQLDIGRLKLVADLYKEEGDILIAQSRASESRQSYIRALSYYLEVGFAETTQPDAELPTEIESLVQKFGLQDLPDGTLWTLFCYYEKLGAYVKAEDALLKLAGRAGLYADIQPELVAFYERLLDKSAHEIDQNGMNYEQIKHKLQKAKQDRDA